MHTKLSRYLWFIISTAAVVTVISLSQFHTTFLGYTSCGDESSGIVSYDLNYLKAIAGSSGGACLGAEVRHKNNDLVRLAWLLTLVIISIDIALMLEKPKSQPRSKRKQKTARRK